MFRNPKRITKFEKNAPLNRLFNLTPKKLILRVSISHNLADFIVDDLMTNLPEQQL